jgi:hypothetical protein
MRPKLGQPLLSIVRNRGPARISLGTRIELREFKLSSSPVKSSQVKPSQAELRELMRTAALSGGASV